MKKIKWIVLIFVCVLGFCNGYSQNPLVKQWDKRFGGTNQDHLNSFQQTADGGYVFGGRSVSDSSGDKTQDNWDTTGYTGDYWIVKIDSLGFKQWDKRFGGIDDENLQSVQQTTDGGYILGGYSYSDSSGDKTQRNWDTICSFACSDDYWIVKTDSLGNKEWDKRIGGTATDDFRSLQQTADGGYILGGSSLSGIGGDKTQPTWDQYDYWIVKIDTLGNKQWDKRFGGMDYDFFTKLCQTIDGGYILGGSSNSDSSGDKTQNNWSAGYDYWIVKTDSLGNKQWDKRFGGTGGEYLYDFKQTNNGGYILAGLSNSGMSGDKTQPNWDTTGCTPCTDDYWIVKIDSIGNKQWDKRFGGTYWEEGIGNITQTTDGGYLIGGGSQSPLSGDKTEPNLSWGQSWIVKTDSLGIKQWDKTIFTLGFDQEGFALQINDRCYVIANSTFSGIGGYKTQSVQGGDDYWIIKFCDSTLTTSITQLPNTQLSFSIFPNPTTGTIQLTFNTKHNAPLKCEIVNVMGEQVYETEIKGTDPDMHRDDVQLDVSFLAKGIYFIKAGNEVRKFMKE